jgi:hypothetical protein
MLHTQSSGRHRASQNLAMAQQVRTSIVLPCPEEKQLKKVELQAAKKTRN